MSRYPKFPFVLCRWCYQTYVMKETERGWRLFDLAGEHRCKAYGKPLTERLFPKDTRGVT